MTKFGNHLKFPEVLPRPKASLIPTFTLLDSAKPSPKWPEGLSAQAE
jgi:hypothetical protein